MDHIHVCEASVVPCDDPEDQVFLAIGREGCFLQGEHQRSEFVLIDVCGFPS